MREPNEHLAQARLRKAALLPRAAELAGEGRSYQEIAAALGIAKSTICAWLRDRPLGRAAARALGTPRMTARLAARYESVYHRAVREWNRSRTDRRTESVVTITPAGGTPTTKTTVRTEPRIGNAACLGKALAATQALEGLHRRERARQERLASDAAEGLASDATGKEDRLTRTVKKENGDADTGSARLANGSAAGTPGDRRKSFGPSDLPLPGCDFASAGRSATMVNEVLQKRGAGTSNAGGALQVSGVRCQVSTGPSNAEGPSLAGASGSDA